MTNETFSNGVSSNGSDLLSLQQTVEVQEGGHSGRLEIHGSLLEAAGLDQHVSTPQKKAHSESIGMKPSDMVPVVDPNNISDREVKEQTGFCSLLLLLWFIAIVCNGDV